MNYNLVGNRRIIQWAGTAATFTTGVPTWGRLSVSGKAAGLRRTRRLVAATGSFSLSLKAASVGRSGASATGSFALTGIAAQLRAFHVLSAATRAFTITGTARLLRRFRLTAAVGSFALAGQAAGLAKRFALVAARGAYTVNGNQLFFVPRLFPVQRGAIAISGVAANLVVDRSQSVSRKVELEWPEEILGLPLRATYVATVPDATVRTSVASQPPAYGSSVIDERRNFSVEFLWDLVQLSAFETFLQDELNGGMRWFQMRHTTNRKLHSLMTHINSQEYTITPQPDRTDLFRVSFKVQTFWRHRAAPDWAA